MQRRAVPEAGRGGLGGGLSGPRTASADARVCGDPGQVPPRTWGLARLGVRAGSGARGRGRKAAEGAQPAPSGGGVLSAGQGDVAAADLPGAQCPF